MAAAKSDAEKKALAEQGKKGKENINGSFRGSRDEAEKKLEKTIKEREAESKKKREERDSKFISLRKQLAGE